MLITRDEGWTGADWPGPRCLVVPAGRAVPASPGHDWRRLRYLDTPGPALSVIRDAVIRLARFRQMGEGALLFAGMQLAPEELAALRVRAEEDPFAADLGPGAGDGPDHGLGWLLLGAGIVSNPLFVPFFANLHDPAAQDPAAVFDQVKYHLVPRNAEGAGVL